MTLEEIMDIYNEAVELYNQEEYEKAFNIFLKLANNGNSDSQNSLADMYYYGEGTKKSLENANYWWEKAAIQGCPDSQCNFGYSEIESNNIKNGLKWIKEAVDNSHAHATYILAGYYYYGKYVEQDRDKAIELYAKASNAGSSESTKDLVLALKKTYGRWRGLIKLLQIIFSGKI